MFKQLDKAKLIRLIRSKLLEKIAVLDQLIISTRASNSETKSSMGDKYETGREMLQQEINNLVVQQNALQHTLSQLNSVSAEPHQKVSSGSFVQTQHGWFFIAVSLGEIQYDGQKVFILSSESPLAKALLGREEGAIFEVNARKDRIIRVI